MGIGNLAVREAAMRPTLTSPFAGLRRFTYGRLLKKVNSTNPQWMVQGQPFSAASVGDEKMADILRVRDWCLFGIPFRGQIETQKQRLGRLEGYRLFLSKIASDPKYGGDACQECLSPVANDLQQARGTKFCETHRAVFCDEYRVNLIDFERAFSAPQGKMAWSSSAQYWMEKPLLGHVSPKTQDAQYTTSKDDADTISWCLADMTWQDFRMQTRDRHWNRIKARSLTTRYWICSETIFRLHYWTLCVKSSERRVWEPKVLGGCIPRVDVNLRKMLVNTPKTRTEYMMLHKFMQQLYARHISRFSEVEGRAPNEIQENALIDVMAGDYLNDQLLKYSRISDLRLFRDFDIKVYRLYEPVAFYHPDNRPAPPSIVCQPSMSAKMDVFTCTIKEAEHLASKIHGCSLEEVLHLPQQMRWHNLGIYVTKIAAVEHIRSTFSMDTLDIYTSLQAIILGTVPSSTGNTPLPAIPGLVFMPDIAAAAGIVGFAGILGSIDGFLRAQTSSPLLPDLTEIRDIADVSLALRDDIVAHQLPRSLFSLNDITMEAFEHWKKDKDVYIIADPASRTVGAMSPLQQGIGLYRCGQRIRPNMSWEDRYSLLGSKGFSAGHGAQVPDTLLFALRGRKALKPPTQQSEALVAAITRHTFWVDDNAAAAFISLISHSYGGRLPKAWGRVIWFELEKALA